MSGADNVLFEASPDIQVLCEDGGQLVARNAAARALGPAEAIEDLFADPEAVARLRQQSFLGADQAVLRLRDGRQVMLAAAPMMQEDSRSWQVVIHDVTTATLVGDEEQVARRLATVGRVGRLASNEITSPLTVLLGRIELLQTLEDPSGEVFMRHLAVMAEHARRIAGVVEDLDRLSHREHQELAPFDLGELVRGLLEHCVADVSHLRMTVSCEAGGLQTLGHRGRVGQALCTLLKQIASQLGPGAGLAIDVRSAGDECQVEFCGRGAPRFAELRERIVASWCLDGPGQDLAAAVAVSILVAHSGAVRPCCAGPGLVVALPRRPSQRPSTPPRRVLFVDDEPTVVAVTLGMLAHGGHDAVGAASAEEALELLQTQTFDVVVSDLVLPGLSGLGLRAAIGLRWPGLEERVVLVSGARRPLPEAVHFLPKPYTEAQLALALERACGKER